MVAPNEAMKWNEAEIKKLEEKLLTIFEAFNDRIVKAEVDNIPFFVSRVDNEIVFSETA